MDDVKEFGLKVRTGYSSAADSLIAPYDAIDCDHLFAPVRHMFPERPTRVIDIGAGTGRDARWLASMGHHVTAIEPVEAFRLSGQARQCDRVDWIDDCLPDLAKTTATGFGFCLINGVWQHLTDPERAVALPRIAGMLAPSAGMILSLRHGPGAQDRPVLPISIDRTLATAAKAGMALRDRVDTKSIQPGNQRAGVTWTWLLLQADPICDR